MPIDRATRTPYNRERMAPPDSESPSLPSLELVVPPSRTQESGTGSLALALEIPTEPAPKSTGAAPAYDDDEKTDPGIELPVPPPQQLPKSAARVVAPAPATQASVRPRPAVAPQLISAATPRTRMPDLGVLNGAMQDPAITEIMVNDVRNVMLERGGKLADSGLRVDSVDELNRMIRAILDISGRVLTPEQPYLDTYLHDGSRVNIVIPPLVLRGPCITIRKFPARSLSLENLIQGGSLDKRIAYFLNACVIGKINLLICGGTGCGKTTLLNALAAYIPRQERIVTIEDTPELRLGHPNSVHLQTKPQTPGSQPVDARELLANALRMRPDRILVGECRRGEALDMLQAMNTGHEGSMTTVHANSPRDGLARLETLCLMSGVELPLFAIRKQITSAIDLIVQIKRYRDGVRRVSSVSEITGMEGEIVTLQDIFTYSTDGKEPGQFKCTGLVPTFLDRIAEQGIQLPRNYFA